LSIGRRSIQNFSKKVAQSYNKKGDGEEFLVLKLCSDEHNFALVNSTELRTLY